MDIRSLDNKEILDAQVGYFLKTRNNIGYLKW